MIPSFKGSFGILKIILLLSTSTLVAEQLKVKAFDGKNWEDIQTIETDVMGYKDKLKVQSAINNSKLFIRLIIKQKKPSLKHRPWVLENEKFVVGSQQEDSLLLRLSQKGKKLQDAWFWGANRTQWGFADDGFFLAGDYKKDSGKGPWMLNLRRETLHQNRSRYLEQAVDGSRGDVEVKASYQNNAWELIFKRSLSSVNKDDLSLTKEIEISFSKNESFEESKNLVLLIKEMIN